MQKKNIREWHVFTDFLKDELRTIPKVLAGKTRLISGAPLAYVIAFRMLFGSFTSAVAHTRIMNGTAIGMNPYSEWNLMVRNLKSVGNKFMAGDYAAFDAREQPVIHEALLDEINAWYDDEWTVARRVLWMEVYNSVHLTSLSGPRDVLVRWNKSLPSGHPATSIINSFYNLVLFVLVWTDLCGLVAAHHFWTYVHVVVLGDDNLLAISDLYIDKFNQHTIPPVMAEYGMTYTDEAKDGRELKEWRPLTECSFLKRVSREDDFRGTWVGALDLETVLYIPYWCTNKKFEWATVTAGVELVFQELALHSESVFNAHSRKLENACRTLIDYVPLAKVDKSTYLDIVMQQDYAW